MAELGRVLLFSWEELELFSSSSSSSSSKLMLLEMPGVCREQEGMREEDLPPEICKRSHVDTCSDTDSPTPKYLHTCSHTHMYSHIQTYARTHGLSGVLTSWAITILRCIPTTQFELSPFISPSPLQQSHHPYLVDQAYTKLNLYRKPPILILGP